MHRDLYPHRCEGSSIKKFGLTARCRAIGTFYIHSKSGATRLLYITGTQGATLTAV